MSYLFEKIVLRPLSIKDREKTLIWRNDPKLRSLVIGYPFPVTERMEDQWYENALADQKNRILFAIDIRTSGEFIGILYLDKIDWISRTAFLGIVLGSAETRSKGYGKEAVLGAIDVAKNYFNFRKISIDVIDHPDGALGFYRKLGFHEEGVFKSHQYLCSEYYDVVRMAVFI